MIKLLHKFFGILHRNGWESFTILATVSYLVSIKGFISASDTNSFDEWMLVQAFLLSFESIPSDQYGWFIIAKLLWMLTFASAAFSLFLKDWSHKQLFHSIINNKHIAIIGVGELSHNYINNLDNNETIILNNNHHISTEQFKEHGYASKDLSLEEIEEILNDNDINPVKNIYKTVINTGNDRDNINLAFMIIQIYIQNGYSHPLRIIVRIENRELNSLFLSNKVFNEPQFEKSKLELKTYSFFEECAVKLFQDNFIDGETNQILDSKEDYTIIVAGNGKLANKIVYEAAKIAHLPNENTLNIYLIDKEPSEFMKSIKRNHTNIDKIPTLNLYQKELDYKSLEYYKDPIWESENLTNVIVCYDDEDINLEIVSSLQDKTFLRKKDIQTKVLFGVFNQGNISNRLDCDDASFNIFKSFGNSKEILTIQNIFDDHNNMLAKLINYTYDGLLKNGKYTANAIINYKQHKNKIDETWFKTNFTDKTSSLAQAKHIKMKLKILGLQAIESTKDIKELLTINREMIDSKFDVDFQGQYPFPNSFEDNLFHQMLRVEHNRWNAYHYLNGWIYSENKNKPLKKHDCLLPIEEFPSVFTDTQRLSELIEWDIYATMYLPNYLAEAGYEITNI